MKLNQRLTDADLARIKEAVKMAEDKISGEIVPVIVDKSGRYVEANFKASLLTSFLSFLVIVLLDRYVIDPTHTLYYDPLFIFTLVAVCGIGGFFLPDISPAFRRFFVSRATLDEVTAQRAENAFLEEEVFNTRLRTGIMLFISFFEHEVIVMADSGISKVVDQSEWDKLVGEIILELKKGRVVEGIEWGVQRCGEILLEKGFLKSDDDINELGDDLRVN